MEEILPFIFLAAWLLFGSIGGKKKREQAEAQRREREARNRARAQARRAEREAADDEGRIHIEHARPEPPRAPAGQPGGQGGSSLDMVPDELWAILTGGAPRPQGPVPVPQEPESYDAYAEGEEQPGGWTTSPPWDEESAVDSIEGVSAEEMSGDAYDYDDEADRIARARYEDIRAVSWNRKPGQTQASHDAQAIRRPETSEARHFEFHDRLVRDEIGASTAGRRRRSARERLGLNAVADVRRAIVLAEILAPPKGLRP